MDIIARTKQQIEYHKMREKWITSASVEQLIDAVIEDSVLIASARFDQDMIHYELSTRNVDEQVNTALETAIVDSGTLLTDPSILNAAKAGMKL